MAFEEFKTDKILIAHVNEKITKTFMAKMGDNSGRVLKVQITNEGEIIDMTGYSVYLLWAHESGTHKGIEAFTAVDATQGVYSLEYPATMLNHAGVLHAYIQVVNPDNDVVNTLNFRIYVQGDNGVMGDTEITDLYATFKQLMADFEEMMNASGVNIKGSYDTFEDLQESVTNPETGDGYLVDGDLYLWLDGAWKNVGRIRGDAGTIQVGTVTSGTTASVTNSGTESAAILDFVLPKGDKGDKGNKGDKGDTGAKGDTGETGATGTPGAAATIQVGTVTTGAPGTQASVTNSGTANAAVLDFTIPEGETGDGGVPSEGEVGQVLKKTATGAEWADESGIETPVSIANGGTGKRTAKAAQNALLGDMNENTSGVDDDTQMVFAYGSPADTQGAVYKRKSGVVWNWIASKIRSVFGFSSSNVLTIANGGTGANNAADALKNLGAFDSGKNLVSLGITDLNDLVEAGRYYTANSGQTATITNLPGGAKGSGLNLLVEYACGTTELSSNVFLIQTLVKSTDAQAFVRTKNSSGWSNWAHTIRNADLANYLPRTGGKLTGAIAIDSGSVAPFIRLDRTINGGKYQAQYTVDDTGYPYIRLYLPDGTYKNLAEFSSDKTSFPNAPVNITSGGTGAKTAKAAQHNLLSGMNSASDTPTDASKLVFAYDASTSNNGAILKRPLSSLWTWIKGKADSIYAAASHTHTMANITDLPNLTLFEQFYQNANTALSGATSKVIYAYRMGKMFFAQCYIVTIQQTKPSGYGQKTTANLTMPFAARKGNMANYPSITIYNSMCLTNGGASESYLGTPDVNSNGDTAITFSQYLGGGGTAQQQTWLVTLTGYLYND